MTAALELRQVSRRFVQPGRVLHAVTDVSLALALGEIVGLVGESGSGKSTLGLIATRLLDPSAGQVLFEGQDITHRAEPALRPLRARLQIVFQDPWSALNPRQRIRRALEEPFLLHSALTAPQRRRAAEGIAARVHLPVTALDRFPHELSGGQLQRVCIARAVALSPKALVLDEPTSSLDLSMRAGILQLLAELRQTLGVAMLFISHDLETLELIADRVVVMYLGRVVEEAPAARLFADPVHPYTQALLSAALPPDPEAVLGRHVLQGDPPSPTALPPGCAFAARCPLVREDCRAAQPAAVRVTDGHSVACLRAADGTSRLASGGG